MSRAGAGIRGAWLAVIALFMAAPIVFVVFYSFGNITYGVFPPPAYSLRWYHTLFSIPGFGASFRNSIEVAAVAACCATGAGTLAAYFVAKRAGRLAAAVRAALIAPLVIPKIALGLAFFVLALRLGMYGELRGLMIAHVIITLPLVTVIMSGAFVSVPRELAEAANDLGAGAVRSFVVVVLPQVRAAVVVSAALAFILSFDEVESSIFLVRPDADPTLPITMFNYISENQNPAPAALSVLLMVVSFAMGAVALVAARRSRSFRPLVTAPAAG